MVLAWPEENRNRVSKSAGLGSGTPLAYIKKDHYYLGIE
jgi:hypothetical protein